MVHHEYTIQNEMGLHARPVSLLAEAASYYKDSKITLSCEGQVADLTHLLAIMDMQVKKGDKVILTVEGGQEQDIADIILNLFITRNL